MQNHKRQLTNAQIAEREALLAHGLPDDYNEEVEEMTAEKNPKSRRERRAAEAKARQKKAREAKIQTTRNKARRKKRKRSR